MRLISLVLLLFALTACNTVEGVGEDIAAGGRALNRAF
ncbi:MAG: entericidin A/B family lipoprotein [Paracoccaceae bacterium]